MSHFKFVNLGVKDLSQLDFNNPIVYRSESLISSMTYSGDASKISSSTAFSDDFKELLTSIDGSVSLGTTQGKFRNIHIYSRNAERLDGVERICYIQQDHEHNNLIVSEFSGSRGAKYSSLYNILTDELSKAGFLSIARVFTISKVDIPKFIEVINLVIKNREDGKYEFYPISEVDSVVINKEKYFYFKGYWREKVTSYKEENDNYDYTDKLFKAIIDEVKSCKCKEELISLKNKFDRLNAIILRQINNLNDMDALYTDFE